jgi:hypothetical protein
MTMIIWPSRKTAERALSVEMLMPPLNNKVSMFNGKQFGLGQFANFHTLRFPQLNSRFNIEYRLATSPSNMNVDWQMFVAVEKEFVAILFKDFRHERASGSGFGIAQSHHIQKTNSQQ